MIGKDANHTKKAESIMTEASHYCAPLGETYAISMREKSLVDR
jgi:hypothetical protein